MQVTMPTITIGFIIALLMLVLAVVFWAVGQLQPIEAGLIAGLAVAILLR